MKEIKLYNGRVALVDDDDFDLMNNYKWSIHKAGNVEYARSMPGKQYMHRMILNLNDPRILVDHIDHNGFNNTKENLRACNKSLNGANRKSANKNSLSKHVGVYWFKQTNRWHARVWKERKCYHLGYFKSESDAALAYNKKATELHGEFAHINNIN